MTVEAGFASLLDVSLAGERGHGDGGDTRAGALVQGAGAADEAVAVLAREPDVAEDRVEGLVPQAGDAVTGGADRRHGDAGAREHERHHLAGVRIVLDEQDTDAVQAGASRGIARRRARRRLRCGEPRERNGEGRALAFAFGRRLDPATVHADELVR